MAKKIFRKETDTSMDYFILMHTAMLWAIKYALGFFKCNACILQIITMGPRYV